MRCDGSKSPRNPRLTVKVGRSGGKPIGDCYDCGAIRVLLTKTGKLVAHDQPTRF